MNPCFIPFLSVHRWLVGKSVVFALLGLLALDGGLYVTSAFALPGVTITPSLIAFTGTVGPGPLTIPVTFTNSGASTVSFTWADSIPWISAGHPAGTLSPGQSVTFTSTAKISGLTAGSYSGIATVTAGGVTTQVPVTLALASTTTTTAGTGFSISPPTLAYTATVGSPNKTASVTVTNTGTTALPVTYSDAVPWLCCIVPSNTLTIQPGMSGTFTLTARLADMSVGSYSGTATISGGGITKQVPVTLALASTTTTPSIGLNTTSLGFAGTVGGPTPSVQTIAISNVGGGTLTWSASDNTAWLALSPVSGTNSGTVTTSVSLSGLAVGTYNATISITAIGAATKTIPVTLTVAASTSGGTGFSISPPTLAYTATVGSSNKTASVTVTNTGTTALPVTYSDAVPWLCCIVPSNTLTIQPGMSGTFTLTAKLAGMSVGSYSGTATISGGGITKQVPVTLALTAVTSAANTAGLSWGANTETDLAGFKVYQKTSLSGTYAAPIATIPKTTASYTVSGLQTGTTYFFVVTAYDNAGNESLPSSEVSKSVY